MTKLDATVVIPQRKVGSTIPIAAE